MKEIKLEVEMELVVVKESHKLTEWGERLQSQSCIHLSC